MKKFELLTMKKPSKQPSVKVAEKPVDPRIVFQINEQIEYLAQNNGGIKNLDYFYEVFKEIYGNRVKELKQYKKEGKKIYNRRKFSKSYINFVEGKPRPPIPKMEEALTDEKARRVAMECQWCLESNCMVGCPAGVDASNFMRRIEANNFIGAARTIRQVNPLGEICGLYVHKKISVKKIVTIKNFLMKLHE